MTFCIAFCVCSFFSTTEVSSVYKNYVLSSYFNQSIEVQYGNLNIIPELVWTGKRNTVSKATEQSVLISTIMSSGVWKMKFSGSREIMEKEPDIATSYDFYLSIFRKFNFKMFDISAEAGPVYGEYIKENDSIINIFNSGIVFKTELSRMNSAINFKWNYELDRRTKTTSHHNSIYLDYSRKRFSTAVTGIFNDEIFPLTRGSTHYRRIELISDGRWELYRAKIISLESYWTLRYLNKLYPDKNELSLRDIYSEGGLTTNITGENIGFSTSFIQGYGLSNRGVEENEEIKAGKLSVNFEIRRGNSKLSMTSFLSIYRFYKPELTYYSDYDIADRGYSCSYENKISENLYYEVLFSYRESQTVFISSNYSGNNVKHRTYFALTRAFYSPFEYINIEQISSIKADYTLLQFHQDRNILNRTFENILNFYIPVINKVTCFTGGKITLQDRGGYKNPDEGDNHIWYFYRNKFLNNWEVDFGLQYGNNNIYIMPNVKFQEKVTYQANGNILMGIETYKNIITYGVEFKIYDSRTQIYCNLDKIAYSGGKTLWDLNLSLLYWF